MDTPCIEFQGYRNAAGYGRVRCKGKRVYAHRKAWEDKNGPAPEGMMIRHRCDNPSCINPDHLLLGSHQDNMQDMVARDRQSKRPGSRNPFAKLTEGQAREIRDRLRAHYWGISTDLAAEFKVSKRTIARIKSGEGWNHVSPTTNTR